MSSNWFKELNIWSFYVAPMDIWFRNIRTLFRKAAVHKSDVTHQVVGGWHFWRHKKEFVNFFCTLGTLGVLPDIFLWCPGKYFSLELSLIIIHYLTAVMIWDSLIIYISVLIKLIHSSPFLQFRFHQVSNIKFLTLILINY